MNKDLAGLFIGEASLDDRSVEFLTNALSANSLEGFDYIKYKQALRGLLQMDLDMDTAHRSAITTAETMGVTESKLAQTAKHYMKVLQQEKKQFDQAMKNQMDQRVSGKKEQATYLKQKINEYEAKIKELSDKIAEYNDQLEHADEEIEQARQKIQETHDKFAASYEHFKETIQSDIDRLKA